MKGGTYLRCGTCKQTMFKLYGESVHCDLGCTNIVV